MTKRRRHELATVMREGEVSPWGRTGHGACDFCREPFGGARARRVFVRHQQGEYVFCTYCCTNWTSTVPKGPSAPVQMFIAAEDDAERFADALAHVMEGHISGTDTIGDFAAAVLAGASPDEWLEEHWREGGKS